MMASQALPSADSDEVKLVTASPEELRVTWQYNSAEWQGPLPLEAYLRREEHLLDQDLTTEGGLTSWILVHQPESTAGKRRILCACETIKKRAFVAKGGQVQDGICHGVASVFCPAEHRGKGYAGKMIKELAKKIRDWQQNDDEEVLFSVLFSDIGKTFYASRGWEAFESSHVHLPAATSTLRPHTRLLVADDLPQLCAEDTDEVRKHLQHASNSRTTVAIVPDVRTIRWHHAREEFFARELLGKKITHKGALVQLADGRRAWCYWQHNWSKAETSPDNKLYILRIVVPVEGRQSRQSRSADDDDADLIEALLAAAQTEAAAWGLHCVELWNPSTSTVVAAQRLHSETQVVHRESNSIASLLWNGEEDWKNVQWVCNERYAWC